MIKERRERERRRTTLHWERTEKQCFLSTTPLCSSLPPSAFLPSGICPFLSPPLLPPPPLFPPALSMWMALYHSARLFFPLSFSLSLSVCVQSCGRSEACIVESQCMWVYRKTHLRRTMRELLELFCIVSIDMCMRVLAIRSYWLHRLHDVFVEKLSFLWWQCAALVCSSGLQSSMGQYMCLWLVFHHVLVQSPEHCLMFSMSDKCVSLSLGWWPVCNTPCYYVNQWAQIKLLHA